METKTALAGDRGEGGGRFRDRSEPAADPWSSVGDPARTLSDTTIDELRRAFDGALLRPGDDGYEDARRVWNGMVDRRPALIARCVGAADVVAALRTARDEGLEVSVRGGGHSIVGHAVTQGGVMIDLSLMRGVHVDPIRRRAWVQGGALLRDVDRECALAGLVTTGGGVSHTGVGGLTLGGGYGYLARLYGLACDNLAAVEVVTASGELLRASPNENPDLFWAVRGGGGNFGVVTGFDFRLHPLPAGVLSVDLAFGVDDGLRALRGLVEVAAEAPEELVGSATIFTARPGGAMPEEQIGRPVVLVSYTYAGDPDAGRIHARRLRAAGTPLVEFDDVYSYRDLQRLGDESQRPGMRRYWKSHYVSAMTDGFLEAFLLRGTADPGAGNPGCSGSLFQLGGAIGRVGPDETAFSGRDAAFDFLSSADWEDAAEDAERLAAGRRYARAIEPYSTGRAYANGLEAETSASVASAYGEATYRRLVAVKDRYDPDNVFHLNQNIAPSRTQATP